MANLWCSWTCSPSCSLSIKSISHSGSMLSRCPNDSFVCLLEAYIGLPRSLFEPVPFHWPCQPCLSPTHAQYSSMPVSFPFFSSKDLFAKIAQILFFLLFLRGTLLPCRHYDTTPRTPILSGETYIFFSFL